MPPAIALYAPSHRTDPTSSSPDPISRDCLSSHTTPGSHASTIHSPTSSHAKMTRTTPSCQAPSWRTPPRGSHASSDCTAPSAMPHAAAPLPAAMPPRTTLLPVAARPQAAALPTAKGTLWSEGLPTPTMSHPVSCWRRQAKSKQAMCMLHVQGWSLRRLTASGARCYVCRTTGEPHWLCFMLFH
jgi:hypothetical protein